MVDLEESLHDLADELYAGHYDRVGVIHKLRELAGSDTRKCARCHNYYDAHPVAVVVGPVCRKPIKEMTYDGGDAGEMESADAPRNATWTEP
jgi:hypothetical protein